MAERTQELELAEFAEELAELDVPTHPTAAERDLSTAVDFLPNRLKNHPL